MLVAIDPSSARLLSSTCLSRASHVRSSSLHSHLLSSILNLALRLSVLAFFGVQAFHFHCFVMQCSRRERTC